MQITNLQARRFLLHRHGLLGPHQFTGQDGIMAFIAHTHAIQYDPVNICGKNADIVLHSRIKDYQKSDLTALLYEQRKLIDFIDKNQCIYNVADFPIFKHEGIENGSANAYTQRGGAAMEQMVPIIRNLIKERGHISAREVGIADKIDWYWGTPKSLASATLETMYMRGELIIHHKKNTVKSYALTEDHISTDIMNTPLPYNTEDERCAWNIHRRIASVGMMWNKPSDAWLCLRLKANQRKTAFARLLAEGKIIEVNADGIADPLYICATERDTLETIMQGTNCENRTEFLAPLDSFMWDRKLIAALFDFEYKWEIYTPQVKRKYGPYTLPILYGDALVGRIDMTRKDDQLLVNNIWMQNGKAAPSGQFKKDLDACIHRFATFNGV